MSIFKMDRMDVICVSRFLAEYLEVPEVSFKLIVLEILGFYVTHISLLELTCWTWTRGRAGAHRAPWGRIG